MSELSRVSQEEYSASTLRVPFDVSPVMAYSQKKSTSATERFPIDERSWGALSAAGVLKKPTEPLNE
jgi:hypothetical protein